MIFWRTLYPDYIVGAFSFLFNFLFKRHLISLNQRAPESGVLHVAFMKEYVLTCIISDETESLRLVKKFYCAFWHTYSPVLKNITPDKQCLSGV